MNAFTIANYLLYIMSEDVDDITNEKVNGLLYLAQGSYLAKYGSPLFDDKIEAWDSGPTIPAVYSAYKGYGDKPIRGYDASLITEIPSEAENLLYDVARVYGRYTADALQKLICTSGSPWSQVYQKNSSRIEITLPLIRSYFASLGELKPKEKEFRDSDLIGYRDAEGILVLPKEWDERAQ